MKKAWLAVLGIVFCGVAVLALIPRNKSEVSDDPYKFYYYPKLNTYYDFQKDNFVYTLNGGKEWRTKRPASASLPEKLSKKILITAPVPDVWRFNEEHRTKYKGVQTDYMVKDAPPINTINRKAPAETDGTTYQPDEDGQNLTASQEKPATKKPKARVQAIPEDEWEQEMDQEAGIWLRDIRRHPREDDYPEEYEEDDGQ